MKKKMTLFPHDGAGGWGAALGIGFIALMYFKVANSLPLPTFLIAALGLAGFLLAIFAIVAKQNRSVLTFISIPIGLLIILWIVGELIFPH